jgi:hypothetical protein
MASQRGMAAICPQRIERKIRMINGFMHDVTPSPGHSYVKAAKGEGHAYSWPPSGRGRGESLISPRRIQARYKAVEAFDLYFHQGLSWGDVAKRLGYADRSGPWRAVRRMVTRQDFDNGHFD